MKVNLKDDQGWIFEDTKSSSILAFNKIQSDQNINEIFDGSDSLFYVAVFYMDKSSQMISRSFMKIQDVSAKVGGIIEFFLTLFSLMCQFLSNFKLQMYIFNKIFSFPEDGLQSDTKFSRYILYFLYLLLIEHCIVFIIYFLLFIVYFL